MLCDKLFFLDEKSSQRHKASLDEGYISLFNESPPPPLSLSLFQLFSTTI